MQIIIRIADCLPSRNTPGQHAPLPDADVSELLEAGFDADTANRLKKIVEHIVDDYVNISQDITTLEEKVVEKTKE